MGATPAKQRTFSDGPTGGAPPDNGETASPGQHTPSGNDKSPHATRGDGVWGWLSVLMRAALPIGVLGGGCFAYAVLSVAPESEKSPPAKVQPIRTRVTKLRVEDYPVVITTHGVVQAHNEVALNAEVSGYIAKVSPAFEVGSYFTAGDVLIELDSRDHTNDTAVAQAQFLGAWSALKLATENLKRITTLQRMSYASDAELNRATAIFEQASAELDSAMAQVERAKRDLERTKIRAPFDGRVRRKLVGLGQSVGPNTSLGIIFAIDFAEVRLPISARMLPYLDLPELPDDLPVEVELRDAINEASDTVWTANIVRTEGALDENSLEVFAVARVDDPFGRKTGHRPLRIGQPVTASITGKVLENVVALPRGAVRQLDQVYLVDETELTLTARTIVPLWSNEEYVIVRDPSIKDGTLLSTTRLVYAPEGAKVEIIPNVEVSTAITTTSTPNEANTAAHSSQ